MIRRALVTIRRYRELTRNPDRRVPYLLTDKAKALG